MGALYKNVCFPAQDAARMEHCAAFDVKSYSGAALVTSECVSTSYSASTFEVCKRTDGGACAMVVQPWPVMPDCDYSGGVSLAYDWFLASFAFVCIVYGGRKLVSLFDNNTIES